jgi:hypothetical protein
MADVLLDIPPWLSATIVRDWIALSCITLLDMAYCAKRARVLLFHAFKVAKLAWRVENWISSSGARKFMRWVMKRDIPVVQLALAGSLSVVHGLTVGLCFSTSLTTIKLRSTPVNVAFFGTMCRNIRDAELFECADLLALGIFLRGVHQTIERLALIACKPAKLSRKPALGPISFPRLTVLIIKESYNLAWNNAIVGKCPALQTFSCEMADHRQCPTLPLSLKRLAMTSSGTYFSYLYEGVRLSQISSLEVLRLVSLIGLSDAQVSAVLADNPQLLAVALQHARDVDDVHLVIISEKVPKLRHLNVSCCACITANGISRLLRDCVHLTDLSIQGMQFALNDPVVLDALRAAVGLQSLDVGGNAVGPEVVYVIAHLPKLEELGVCGARFPSRSAGLDYIAAHAPRLRTVYGSDVFNNLACSMWAKMFPHIKLVTNRISSEFWSELDLPTAPTVDLTEVAVDSDRE